MLAKTTAHRATATRNLVRFCVGEAFYGIDIGRVLEVVHPMTLSPIPQAPYSVVGVAQYRGEIVPVMDLRVRFQSSTGETRKAKWILVSGTHGQAALVVDGVSSVISAPEEEEGAVPALADGGQDRAIVWACRRSDGLVFVLDVDRLIRPALANLDAVEPE